MDPVIQTAYHAALRGQSFAFATVISATIKGTPRKTGAKMAVLSDGTIAGTIGGGRNEKAAIAVCLKSLQTGKAETVTYDYFGKEGQSVCGGQIKVLIEPFAAQKTLLICGAGHIALPLSFIGKLLNFKVVILDSRKDFANTKRFPHVDQILVGKHAEKLGSLPIDQNTYIMIVTHGNEYDYECLETVIKSSAAYLGVISSQAKRIKFAHRLKKSGFSEKLMKRVKIPSGVDIGAQTPEEIAISIAAEIVQEYNKQWIATEKFKKKS